MARLAAPDLLALWEDGPGLHPIDGALRILAAAMSDRDADELARLPLGERDALLLDVRRATFGDTLEARDTCPACGVEVELDMSCADMAAAGAPPPPEWPLEHDGFRLTVRPLDSRDAAAAARMEDADAARAVLLERAVVDAERAGRRVPVDDLPPAVIVSVASSVAEHDERAEMSLSFVCPACGHRWTDVLDVARFVGIEMAAEARRILDEVDLLARTYGWRESDILALGEARRSAYVARAQS